MAINIRRALAPIVQLQEGESTTAVLMFAYSFLAMTAYNIVKPITRSKFISDLGADNLPWVQLGAGILIGLIMHAYSRATAALPRRVVIPLTQAACAGLLLIFWVLFSAGYQSASVGFYVLGLILGILLVSQFWTLANDVYDPRQAKRLFGFIGGGASLGGATGAAITAIIVGRVGTVNLLLVSAGVMVICAALVVWIVRREESAGHSAATAPEEGIGGTEAISLLRQSRHLQLIAIVIGCAAMGGAIIEQQLNMAAEARLGQGATDGITQFLAQVTVYLSLIGFAIQVAVTSRVHRLLGLGFALMVLPVSLGTTAGVMLFNAGLWAPGFARILDTSLRYTVDKTTREILFLPLSAAVKYRAKPFVDVTMDRFAKALGALTILVLIKPWGFALSWQQLSYASLTLTVLWIVMAIRAKREYLAVFRRSIERRDVQPAEIGMTTADLQSIETLIEELGHPDETRVLYAIELLESLDKRHLVTPLLLQHASPRVRARALQAIEGQSPQRAAQFLPAIEGLLSDDDAEVRTGAVRAIAAIRGQEAADLMRGYLAEPDARIVVTAAAVLAMSPHSEDVDAAALALQLLAGETGDDSVRTRREVAAVLGQLPDRRFRQMLIPLMFDSSLEVARTAIRSSGQAGVDGVLLSPLVSLLRHRVLKEEARSVLVGYGDEVIEPLAYFLKDKHENTWVRRHIPAALARLPGQRSVNVLLETLADKDSFLRFKAMAALVTLKVEHPDLIIPREPIEKLILDETRRFFDALTLQANLCGDGGPGSETMLSQALEEKQKRSRDRTFRLLGLIYPPDDVDAARRAIEEGDSRSRASANEYLDNVLTGPIRKRVMLLVDEMSPSERVSQANRLFRTRRRSVEDTLAQLIHDEDQVLVAAAIYQSAEGNWRTLAADVEHALAHHDLRDWYVFEAASWALAAWRVGAEERRNRWLEPLPTVEVVNRLRRLPLFRHVSINETFRIAGEGRQMRHEAGTRILSRDVKPDALHLLVDGAVEADGEGRITAPAVVAFAELIDAVPMGRDVRATEVAITLALTLDNFLTLLSNNIELSQGLFGMLMGKASGTNGADVLPGHMTPEIARLAAGRLSPVEKVLVLRTNTLFERATSEQLLKLASYAREVPLQVGTDTGSPTAEPALLVLLSGAMAIEREGAAPVAVRPGDIVGAYGTLTGGRDGVRARATETGAALRLDRRALFDLLADHVELLQGMFAAVLHRRAEADSPVAGRV
jgi:AAA family ATP:ADP antiporter